MQALLGDDPKPKAKVVPKPQSPQPVSNSPENKKVTTAAVPEFELMIARAQGIVIVDDSLSNPEDMQHYSRLLHNMCFALGLPNISLAMDTFKWPMVKSSSLFDQGEAAARQTLEAFLNKQVTQLQPHCIIAMGDQAARYIGIDQNDAGHPGMHANLKVPALRTQSALKAMAQPELKAFIWRDLQPVLSLIKKD